MKTISDLKRLLLQATDSGSVYVIHDGKQYPVTDINLMNAVDSRTGEMYSHAIYFSIEEQPE